MLERSHVIDAITQLDQEHTDVLSHGHDHFPETLSLGIFPRREIDFSELGHPVDQSCDLGAKIVLDVFDSNGGVFDDVVEQPRAYTRRVKLQISDELCHPSGVSEIGLPTFANLLAVGPLAKIVGATNQLEIGRFMVRTNALKKFVKPAHLAIVSPSTKMKRPPSDQLSRNHGFGVYVHFPWCVVKCPYCDFLSLATGPHPARDPERPSVPQDVAHARATIPHRLYADAVLRELTRRAPHLDALPLQSIFIGGGTPSLWAPEELGRVLRGISETFECALETIEVTAECNPTSLDDTQLAGLKAAGVNRLSVGVQSIDRTRLEFLGRLHDPLGGLAALERARRAGVENLSADLIYGIYQQAPESAVREVEVVHHTGVDHLSAYLLTVEANTRFGALHKAGRLPLLEEHDVSISFEEVSRTLRRLGFEHYEISNFARPGARSVHNQGYWHGDDYLGLGLGAVGTVKLRRREDARFRSKNVLSLDKYLNCFGPTSTENDPYEGPAAEREWISPEVAIQESLLLGLRTSDGIDLNAEGARRGVHPWTDERQRAVAREERRGRLLCDGGRLRIPHSAWVMADAVIRELL